MPEFFFVKMLSGCIFSRVRPFCERIVSDSNRSRSLTARSQKGCTRLKIRPQGSVNGCINVWSGLVIPDVNIKWCHSWGRLAGQKWYHLGQANSTGLAPDQKSKQSWTYLSTSTNIWPTQFTCLGELIFLKTEKNCLNLDNKNCIFYTWIGVRELTKGGSITVLLTSCLTEK